MPTQHAKLSASSAHRWLNCTPSAHQESLLPDKSSPAAEEGTIAHALAECKLLSALGRKAPTPPVSDLIDQDMEAHTDDYVGYVLERLADVKKTCADPLVLVEERLDYSHLAPGGFGTGDCVIIAEPRLEIIDFKYGKGVQVAAEYNPQLSLYAAGALATYRGLYGIDRLRLTIFQPRLGNLDSWETTVAELDAWCEDQVKPAAMLAWVGAGEYKPGSWCGFCKLKQICRARAEQELELVDKYFINSPETLADHEISEIVTRSDEFTKWVKGMKEFALEKALEGKHWPGLKLVEGRAVRKYLDENAIAETLAAAGIAQEDIYKQEIKTITALEKTLGKKRFSELTTGLIHTPPGKPTLVSESDKRPAISVGASIDDFDVINEQEKTTIK